MSDSPANKNAENATKPADGPPMQTHVESAANYKEPYTKRFKRYCNRNLHKTPIWIEAACALGLVVITVTYTHYARQQAASAIVAAKAAEGANKIANDSLLQVHRPWLAVDGTMISLEPIKIGQVTISAQGPQTQIQLPVGFWIKNFGTAPAFHTAIYVALASYQIGMDVPTHSAEFTRTADATCKMAELESRPISPGDKGNGSYIFPDNRFPMQWNINETSPKRQLNTWLTIVGCITYRDQFKDTSIHHTRFCFRSLTTITDITAKQSFEVCGQNEEAD